MSFTAVPRLAAVLLAVLLPLTGEAQTLSGTVTNSETGEPVQDAVVSARSPSLNHERTVVTDAEGRYRMPSLPPGGSPLRFERERYQPYTRCPLRTSPPPSTAPQLLPCSPAIRICQSG